jgi:hypothetical protein
MPSNTRSTYPIITRNNIFQLAIFFGFIVSQTSTSTTYTKEDIIDLCDSYMDLLALLEDSAYSAAKESYLTYTADTGACNNQTASGYLSIFGPTWVSKRNVSYRATYNALCNSATSLLAYDPETMVMYFLFASVFFFLLNNWFNSSTNNHHDDKNYDGSTPTYQ